MRFTRNTTTHAPTAIVNPVDLLRLSGQYTHTAYVTAPQIRPPKRPETDLANVIGVLSLAPSDLAT
jgi:hypothetical protein